MKKNTEVKGKGVEVKKDRARVQFSNGDSRWFTINNDQERKHYALGKTLAFIQSSMPTNRDELFAFLETFVPKRITHFLATWAEGIVRHKGKRMLKGATGAGLNLADAVHIFGTPSGKYFFVNELGSKNTSRHRYAKPLEVEDALVRIAEAINAKTSAKRAA